MWHSYSVQRKVFETYIRYNLYFKDIWYNSSAQRKVCLKHIPDIAYTLNMYDIFEMYTRWNIYTNKWMLTIILYEILMTTNDLWNLHQ